MKEHLLRPDQALQRKRRESRAPKEHKRPKVAELVSKTTETADGQELMKLYTWLFDGRLGKILHPDEINKGPKGLVDFALTPEDVAKIEAQGAWLVEQNDEEGRQVLNVYVVDLDNEAKREKLLSFDLTREAELAQEELDWEKQHGKAA